MDTNSTNNITIDRDTTTRQSLFNQIREFLRNKFNLDEDKASEDEVKENIRRSVDFKGTNLWVLIFAIVIASVGLNVNSTAVIIGAMLISPLMGPIMGMGMGLAINDFDLFKRAGKNFLWAVAISLTVSTLYFTITPLNTAQSELLARTTPTIWDVLIALFGGLAGIVAQSRKDRTSTVIPGVAIATALMPPLCTAGFGLATGNMTYFGGAFYLFFINTVFIALATFIVVRFLNYQKKTFLDKKREKRVKNLIMITIATTMVPSIIIAYGMVQRAIFENNAKLYITEVLKFEKADVISSNIKYDRDGSTIEVTLIGENVSNDALNGAQNLLDKYNLRNTELIINQASNIAANMIDGKAIESFMKSNADILIERNKRISELEAQIAELSQDNIQSSDIARELSSLWPVVNHVSLSRGPIISSSGERTGSIIVCLINTDKNVSLSTEEINTLKKWLATRTKSDNIEIMIKKS